MAWLEGEHTDWATLAAHARPFVAFGGVPLNVHGNPNVLTRDVGASRFSQECAAQTCLVQVEPIEGEPPPVRAFEPPRFVARGEH